MKRSSVEKPRTWEQFKAALPGAPGKKYFTAVANRRLDAIVRDEELPLEDRFDAFLIRSSWGNFSDFACDRVNKSQEPAEPEEPLENVLLKPLGQVDFCRILGASKQRISEIVKLRQEQGLIAAPEDQVNPGRLCPLYEPARPVKGDVPRVTWEVFLTEWNKYHATTLKALEEARAAAAPFIEAAAPYLKKVEEIETQIRRQRLADFKVVEKAVPTSADPVPASPDVDGQKVRTSPDKKSGPERTVFEPAGDGHDIDPRARGHKTLNLNTTTTPGQSEQVRTDVVVVADKLLIKEKAAKQFLEECRRQCPDAELADVLGAIEEVRGTIGSHIRNPVAIILENAPAKVSAYRAWRLEQRPTVDKQPERDRAAAELILQNADDPLISEDDKHWAREVLGQKSEAASND